MGLLDGAVAVAMYRATGGNVVVSGGVTTWGHFERVPVIQGEDAGGYVGGDLSTQPSVAVADVFTNIGLRKGIGETVTVDGTDWKVDKIVPLDPDGGTFRLMLRTPDA